MIDRQMGESDFVAPAEFVLRLGLFNDPFSDSAFNEYFYPGAGRNEILQQLVHLGRFSDQPIVLSGAAGSGKRTLADAAVAELHSLMDCCRLAADELPTPAEIISLLSEHLHLPIAAGASLAETVAALRSIASVDNQPEPILIVVDRAQQLEQDCLQLLLDLQRLSDGAVHLLLLTETSLLDEKNIAYKQLDLLPLSLQESQQFVLELLKSVGYASDQLMTAKQWSALHQQSAGNLAAIKQLMPVLLSEGRELADNSGSLSLPFAHKVAAVALLLVLVLAYSFFADDGREQLVDTETRIDKPVIRKSTVLRLPEVKSATPSQPELGGAEAVVDQAETKVVEKVEPVSVDEPLDPPPTESPPPVKVEAIKPESGEEIARPEPVASESVPGREQRLLKLQQDSYMLQLLGARSESNAIGLVKQYRERLPVTYFETRLKGKPWYVVVTGPYENEAKAKAGVGHLPAALRAQKPWLRKTAAIQADIRKLREIK